jgi:hypothetical protein
VSSGTGFEAAVRLSCETGCALFGNYVDMEGTLSEEVEASRNRLVVVVYLVYSVSGI